MLRWRQSLYKASFVRPEHLLHARRHGHAWDRMQGELGVCCSGGQHRLALEQAEGLLLLPGRAPVRPIYTQRWTHFRCLPTPVRQSAAHAGPCARIRMAFAGLGSQVMGSVMSGAAMVSGRATRHTQSIRQRLCPSRRSRGRRCGRQRGQCAGWRCTDVAQRRQARSASRRSLKEHDLAECGGQKTVSVTWEAAHQVGRRRRR